MKIIEWILNNANISLVIANFLLVIVTGYYAFTTHKILIESRKEREALFRPYIVVSPKVYPDNPIIYLSIKNFGKTPAKKLRLTLNRDFYQFGEKKEENNLRNFRIFKDVTPYLFPEEEIVFALAQGFVIFNKDANPEITPSEFDVTVEYEYYLEKKRKIKEDVLIDLKPYLKSQIVHDPLADIRDELRKVNKSLINELKEINKSIRKVE